MMFSIFHWSRSSCLGYWKALDVTYLEPGYWAASRKDVSDDEWEVFSTIAVRSFAWLGLHSFGTQYFKKFNPEVSITVGVHDQKYFLCCFRCCPSFTSCCQ